MLKSIITGIAAAGCIVSMFPNAVFAFGYDSLPQTTYFNYTRSGNDIKVGMDKAIDTYGRAANVIIAMYEDGKLITTEVKNIPEGSPEFKVDDFIITIPEGTNVTQIKSFLWTDDNKCYPLCDAADYEFPFETYEYIGRITNVPGTLDGLSENQIIFKVANTNELDNVRLDIDKNYLFYTCSGSSDIVKHHMEKVKLTVIKKDGHSVISEYTPIEDTLVSFESHMLADDYENIKTDYMSYKKLPVYQSDDKS